MIRFNKLSYKNKYISGLHYFFKLAISTLSAKLQLETSVIDQVDRERGANRNQSREIQFIHAKRLTHHPNTRYTLLVMDSCLCIIRNVHLFLLRKETFFCVGNIRYVILYWVLPDAVHELDTKNWDIGTTRRDKELCLFSNSHMSVNNKKPWWPSWIGSLTVVITVLLWGRDWGILFRKSKWKELYFI